MSPRRYLCRILARCVRRQLDRIRAARVIIYGR